jgi:prepilin-type N-terminal cleavage/methylation domain-containing protein
MPLRSAPHPAQRAFTLVELCVVVFIIGMLAAIALPTLKRISQKARVAAVANDLRTFTTALQTYNLQYGKWPADVTPGVMPKEMVGALPNAFTLKTPIGGNYDWDQNVSPNGFLTKAAITLITQGTNKVSSDTALLTAIDKALDDGNLKTGNVRLGSTNALVYIIEL